MADRPRCQRIGHRITLDTNVLAETVDAAGLVFMSNPGTVVAKSMLVERASVRALWGDYANPLTDPRFQGTAVGF